MRLTVEHVGFRIDDRVLLEDIQLDVPSGSMTGLVGPNGAGKSTLLRLLAGSLVPQTGIVWVDDRRLWELDTACAADLVGGMPPAVPGDGSRTVAELVATRAIDAEPSRAGRLLGSIGLAGLTDRRLDQLSDSERRRALIARTLVRPPGVLLLDEPLDHLDVRSRHEVLRAVRDLGLTTIVALGDVDLAVDHCDRLAILVAGRIAAAGPTAEVLVPDVIAMAFGMGVTIVDDPTTGRPRLLFHRPDERVPADQPPTHLRRTPIQT